MRPDPLRAVFADADAELVDRFLDYHRDHPTVFAEFAKRAVQMRAAGRQRYSQWTIVQAIRWHHDLRSHEAFKINNDFIALYARLMIHEHPEFAKFFELRSMKPAGRAMSHEEVGRGQ
jgi:hypothetical protein